MWGGLWIRGYLIPTIDTTKLPEETTLNGASRSVCFALAVDGARQMKWLGTKMRLEAQPLHFSGTSKASRSSALLL